MSGAEHDDLSRFPRAARAEAHRQATTLLGTGVPVDEARAELIDNGIAEELASATIAAVVEARRESWRSRAWSLVYGGGALLAGGAAFTAWTYATAADGGVYFIADGAMASGAAALLLGIGMLLRPRPS